ncbi:PilT/PilU family type 4a pilus ATPase [Ruminobacter sp.]|jgi:twitching motility protein PilU|uniref:PilT/PilU family type 4a pilus ATPase n=1 Tax=Ruminobacter sp. TaxID=2774296 RepID=UPI001B0B62C2|nr:PilT/PilU family type 4a pilus ATPase [Ruminobacter sp.]MBO6009284.1 PilT/PilU family type 4a pilus ATPase [Ruminobacter sp.]MBP3748214.1 PilT/PilU family type 4a pilus ATPase [Ruminobacter sp.]
MSHNQPLKIDRYLQFMNENKASDLFLTVDLEPAVKLDGHLTPIEPGKLTYDQVLEFVQETLIERPDLQEQYVNEREANFAIYRPELGRYRVSCFWQLNNPGVVFRRIVERIPTTEELHLPPSFTKWVMEDRGLLLFVGATGAGKSTTQAAMIGHRNMNSDGHILTIEDPIEYVHHHQRSLITQREVGTDTVSFDAALKSALRQAPDVILIGEIRSKETMEFALSFAETGHLVLATLHANNANQAIDRILHLVPESNQRQMLFDLSVNLKAIIAQQLIETTTGGRRAAFDILVNTPTVSDCLQKNELYKLKDIMLKSPDEGMTTFDKSLFELYQQGVISYHNALHFADSENEVRLMIKLAEGVKGSDEMSNIVFE